MNIRPGTRNKPLHGTRRALTGLLLAATVFNTAAAEATAEYRSIDPAASSIGFGYTQMGVAMQGKFGQFKVELAFDPARPETASALLELPLNSIDTGSAEANNEVKGAAWFNVAAHPVARFKASTVKALGNNRFELNGTLSIKGRSHPISAPLTLTPLGTEARFAGSFVIRRNDFAIGEGAWADTSLVGNEITVNFQILGKH